MLDRILDTTGGTLAAAADPGETVSSGGAVWGLEAMTLESDVVDQKGGTPGSVPQPDGTSVEFDELPVNSE